MHLLGGESDEGLFEADPAGMAGSRALYVQRATVVQVVCAQDDVLHYGHQRVPPEFLPIVEVYADQPCRSGMHTPSGDCTAPLVLFIRQAEEEGGRGPSTRVRNTLLQVAAPHD